MNNKRDQTNFQQAKAAAQRLFKKVNYQGGNLQSFQLSTLMQQTYDILKIPFKPTNADIKSLEKVLDANGDGSVSLSDLQTMAVNYLCGDGVLSQIKSNKKLDFQQSQYGNKFTTNTTQQNNYSTSNTNIGKTNINSYEQKYSNSNYNGLNTQNAYNNTKFTKNTQSFTNSSYGTQNLNQNSSYNKTPQINSYEHQSTINENEHKSSRYNQTALNYLNITRNLFKKYANRQTNTITIQKVANLLNETYSALGRDGYYPTGQDVNIWMKLCDSNQDGHVEDSQYEYFVIRSLQRSGIKVTN